MESRIIKASDKQVQSVAGMELPFDWWSRRYEYAFALDFAEPSQVVADMGCGWMYRPFKNAVADIVGKVYAVDSDPRLLDQRREDNMEMIVAKMEATPIPDKACDRVFCISVLEDLQDPAPALKEFARIMKDDGLAVITMDVPYDIEKPTPVYPGLNYDNFLKAVEDAGLEFAGDVDTSRLDAVFHSGWNLCVFRCVLKKQSSG